MMRFFRSSRRFAGFTLIELMVVIVIMTLLAGIAIPTMGDFLRKRRLRSGGDQVQTGFLKARSRAIAQRERQYLIFFTQAAAYAPPWGAPDVSGQVGSFHAFDSDEGQAVPPTPPPQIQDDPVQILPEYVSIADPNVNFAFTFHVDGTVQFHNIADRSGDPGIPDTADENAQTYNNVDLVLQQDGSRLRCFMDISSNTGRIWYVVRMLGQNED